MKRKFNLLSGAIYEYRVVMNEQILGDTKEQQHKACVERADLFALLINGFARGTKDKQQGLFDAAVPQAPAPKKHEHEKADRPMIKVFASSKAMRRIQAEFGDRIEVIVRAGNWTDKGLKASFRAWKHPRGKKAEEAPKSAPASTPEGYT